jgi:urease subunit alpha
VNELSIQADIAQKLELKKQLLPARGTRKLTKKHMLHNDACPNLAVDPQTFVVSIDGEPVTCEPAAVVPLAQRYLLR